MHRPSLVYPPQKAEHSIGGPNVAKARRQAQSASSKGPPRRCASVDGYRCVRSDPSPGQTLAPINSTPRTASAIANWRVSHSYPAVRSAPMSAATSIFGGGADSVLGEAARQLMTSRHCIAGTRGFHMLGWEPWKLGMRCLRIYPVLERWTLR